MTSDGDALLRAICEAPWEDTPRLVFADWLEENGQPERAEFIRLQIELKALPHDERFGTPQYDRASALEQKWDPSERAIARKTAKNADSKAKKVTGEYRQTSPRQRTTSPVSNK